MTVADKVGEGECGEENHDVLDVLDVANDFSGRRNFFPPFTGRRFPVVFDK
jgi:hypothetical protein